MEKKVKAYRKTSWTSLTIVSIIPAAIERLLICKTVERIGLNRYCRFKRNSNWKGPTWSAQAWILYWSYNSSCPPINFTWGLNCNWRIYCDLLSSNISHAIHQTCLNKLFMCHVDKLVDCHCVCLSFVGIMLPDFVEVLLKDNESISLLFSIVSPVEFKFKTVKFSLVPNHFSIQTSFLPIWNTKHRIQHIV